MKKFISLYLFIILFSQILFSQTFLPTIIGGEDVTSMDDPVALSTVHIKGFLLRSTFSCSGVLIAQDLVITAAHCLGPGWAKTEIYLANGIGPFNGVKYARHPKYNERSKLQEPRFDLAVIKLNKPVPQPFHPVEINNNESLNKANAPTLLAGYGQNVPSSNPDGTGGIGVLRKVDQEMIDPEFNPYEFLVNIRNKGSCFGDSGGPAFVIENNTLFLSGITSRLTENNIVSAPNKKRVYSCLTEMIYSNLSHFTDWISLAKEELSK